VKKIAEDFNWNVMLPGAGAMGLDDTPRGLPSTGDTHTDKIVWNTAGNTITIASALIGLKLLANKLARKELEKKKKRAHENKVNAMHAYSTPNTAPQAEAVDKVRSLGVTKESSIGTVAVPLMLATPAALAITKIVTERAKDDAEDEADEKLAEARNELDALHAKLLKLRLKKSASSLKLPIIDDDEDEDDGDDDDTDEVEVTVKSPSVPKPAITAKSTGFSLLPKAASNEIVNKGVGGYLLTAALVAGLTGATVYTLTKDKDKERKRKKLLEKQIFAQNLTNTPNQVELLLGKHAPFPTDESRQTYIKEIADSVKAHD